MQKLRDAVVEVEASDDIDPRELSRLVDRLQAVPPGLRQPHAPSPQGSLVVDVGRAHRSAQPAQWRALKARYRTCAAPGCERPLGWTQAHHVEFWSRGGETNARRLVPICYYHHRLVHEGGWQVVTAGERVEFVPPESPVMFRRWWGERRWAA